MPKVTYAAFDAEHRCLYVGASFNPDRRRFQHSPQSWYRNATSWQTFPGESERDVTLRLRPIHSKARCATRPVPTAINGAATIRSGRNPIRITVDGRQSRRRLNSTRWRGHAIQPATHFAELADIFAAASAAARPAFLATAAQLRVLAREQHAGGDQPRSMTDTDGSTIALPDRTGTVALAAANALAADGLDPLSVFVPPRNGANSGGSGGHHGRSANVQGQASARQLWAQGVRQVDIARRLGVTTRTVRRWLRA